MNYLDISTVEARRHSNAPANRSRTGYGSKLPTRIELRLSGRWHRVYAICWSNAATFYICKGGGRLYIATGDI